MLRRSSIFLLVIVASTPVAAQQFVLSGDAFSSVGGVLSHPGGLELGFTVGQFVSGLASSPGPGSGIEECSGFWRWMLWRLATNVDRPETEARPSGYQLEQGYPNPFNPSVTIRFAIPDLAKGSTMARLRICGVSGRLVRVLVNEPARPGFHSVAWDGRDDRGRHVGNGIYFCTMDAGTFHASRKLVMLE